MKSDPIMVAALTAAVWHKTPQEATEALLPFPHPYNLDDPLATIGRQKMIPLMTPT